MVHSVWFFVCLFVFFVFVLLVFFGRGQGSVSKMASISVKSPGTPYCFPFWLNPQFPTRIQCFSFSIRPENSLIYRIVCFFFVFGGRKGLKLNKNLRSQKPFLVKGRNIPGTFATQRRQICA